MKHTVRISPPRTQKTGCIVVAVFERRRLSDAAAAIDKSSRGAITRALKRGDVLGMPGSSVVLHSVAGIAAERVLVVGAGKRDRLDQTVYRKVLGAAYDALVQTGARDAGLCLAGLEVSGRDLYWKCRQIVEIGRDKCYRFDQFKSKAPGTAPRLKRASILVDDDDQLAVARTAVQHATAIANGVDLAKDLGNMPGNACTPTYLGDHAKQMGREHSSLKVKVLGEAAIRKLEMGSFLSVAAGSRQPPKLIVLEHTGGDKTDAPVVLVGKGVTFDSGGISIKPSGAMDEMKFDMCGAASVFGAMLAVTEMKLPINVVGIVPATENLPDGKATKPGDIVTSMSGKTIEVLNTDAEGRLILCDALTYASRYEPDTVVDIATLTGACVVALGSHASGLFGNDSMLAADLLEAGQYTGDRAWEMPLWDEYQEQLKSNFADMANVGGREAGAVTAACFLARFTEEYRWAHLDIAGAAWRSGARKGASGRPVKLLTQYLLNRC